MTFYIIISIVALLLIAGVIFQRRKDTDKQTFTALAALAFVFVILGITFGEDRLIGYSLIGFGVLLAIIDIVQQHLKTKK
ncbi:hypothetical protein [Kangiella sediminilitoris]|uniref:Uncharacterized protein n=1 Tax=Kangiella sediminilitoris TaxID=1144748 RepID=A0A1B3BDS4_9GAMM|nr:hypothetical protein [Kangiella sediminilitoris]AOE50913.1 hypothetical protein KS2013_2208 [Kangiella sediminilitoris]